MKRFLALLLGFLLCLGTAGYLHYDVYADDDIPAVTTKAQIKQEVLKNLDQVNPDFTISTKIPIYQSKEVDEMFKNIIDELSTTANYGFGNLTGYSYYISSKMGFIQIKVEAFYLTTPQQEQKINRKIAYIVKHNHLKEMTDFEKVYFVNKYIASHTKYSSDATDGGHSAYAVLFDHKAVCQGYALAAYRILTEAGVETKYITGQVKGSNHAWNKVKVNGKWYNLDITWNDPMPDRGDRYRLNYFLISDQQLAKDHVWKYRSETPATSQKYEFLMNAQAFNIGKNNFYYTLQNDSNFYKWNMKKNKKTVLFQNYIPLKYIDIHGQWLTLKDFDGDTAQAKIDGSDYTGFTQVAFHDFASSLKK
ncbi:transglutaminase domain-containing protein [Rummeliibacillus sp. SL167]|uniref:transglutaminase domain-containing protein n=1 Tax=Rummeliibacillus sp. SL167 TaxID=2579792 RepID=UPI0011B7A204|nr:transglutaminase domain-containing protein [Rummeliibacillus sp. SL167]